MDESKIIDYVMNTPHNTNRAVLQGIIEEFKDKASMYTLNFALSMLEEKQEEGEYIPEDEINALFFMTSLSEEVLEKDMSLYEERLDTITVISEVFSVIDSLTRESSSEDIDTAQALVTALPDGKAKIALQNKLDLLLHYFEVATIVENVTINSPEEDYDVLEELSIAQALVTALPDGDEKTDLQNKLDFITLYLEALGAVDLYRAGELAEEEALLLVNALPDGTEKTDLLAYMYSE